MISRPPQFLGKAKCVPARDTLLLPYQSRWVKDDARLKLAEKGRQLGWTWGHAYRLVSKKSLSDARNDAWISSRDDLQARLLIEDCKNFASILNAGAKDLGERVIDDDGHSAYVLAMANGLRLHSMSSNPDAQAGKRGDRTLDEFALHPDPRKLYAIAYPGITWGGSMEIFSTHRGTANFFNQLIIEIKHKGNPKGFSLHTVTLQTALEQGFLYKLQTKLPADDPRQQMDEAEYFDFIRAGCADDETFQQEYMCQPADDGAAFLSYELIDRCKYQAGIDWKLALDSITNPIYIGVDVARTTDLTVIWLLEAIGDMRFTRRMIELKNMKFSAQEEILYPLLERPNVRRCCIDQSGLGRQFAERAQEKFGYKVEGVSFTGPVKEELAYPVRAAFEDGTVRVPDDKFLISDLRSIRKETTASGNVRFAGERDSNGHADRFWALALALHAGKTAVNAGPIQAFPRNAGALADKRNRSCVGA